MDTRNPDRRTILERIESLENKNRLLKALNVGLILVLCAGGLAVCQFNSPREIETERLVIKDAQGSIRATLGNEGDKTLLGLFDADGKQGIALVVEPIGPHLSLNDRNKTRRADLALSTEGPQLVFSDAKGVPRASLAVKADNVYLSLIHPSGQGTIELGFDEQEPDLNFFAGKDQKVRAQIGASFVGLDLASFINGDQKTGLSLVASSPVAVFTGPRNGVRVEMEERVPRLDFVDENGHTLRTIH